MKRVIVIAVLGALGISVVVIFFTSSRWWLSTRDVKVTVNDVVHNSIPAYKGRSGEILIKLSGTETELSDYIYFPDSNEMTVLSSTTQFIYLPGVAFCKDAEPGTIPLSDRIKVENDRSVIAWTQTDYNDVGRFVVVKSDLAVIADGKKVATQFFDQLGRVRLSKTLEDAAAQSATNETDGIKIQTRYKTASGYTYQLTSNPFRATNPASETDPTMGWTLSTAWSNGRRSEVQTFSGSGLPSAFGGSNTSSTGIVRTDIDANRTLVTDQAQKQRLSVSNALGQLKEVWEILGASETGSASVSFPNTTIAHGFKTEYSYDTLGKMVHVQQGVQDRWFMYSSLGRLLRVKQPEQDVNTSLNTTDNPGNNSWTARFTYDDNGNVLTAKDAKNTEITSTYDALNRPLTRSYSDGTPTVTNTYDGSGMSPVPDRSKGKLTRVYSSVSDSRYTEFDEAGRLEEFRQITDGQTYTSRYEYNLSGALTKETYPSGRVVQNEFDANGDLSKIFGKATTTAIERIYASNFSYSVDGKIEKLKLGSGVWESAKFNSRLQVKELSVGWGPTSGSVWQMQTEYGELQTNGTVDATKNSGNIGKQTVSFTGLANPFVQTFKYDTLYRLTEAKETNNGNQTWRQVFGYDRYGNRTVNQKFLGTSTTETTQTDETNPEIDDARNRFKTTEGYTFDANGNVVVDFTGRQFTFNGDNKQIQVKNAANKLLGTYFYDGEGKRVKKLTYDQYGAEKDVTVFVYSGGKLIAEYTTEAPPQNPTTRFTITDSIGSPRVILNSSGGVVSRRDFLPFGEEIAPDGTYRKTDQKYGEADNVRQKFTGYQHDGETGLDFAEARMYENRHGRFTAVDPLLASGKSADPQTFNRYVYVMNNPLILTDPTGLQAGEDLDDPNRPADYRVDTVCRGFKCWIQKSFDAVARIFIGNSGPNDSEEEQFAERKRGGVDKQVRAALNNSIADLNTATDAVVNADQTGILNATKVVVNNSLGLASDDEVYSAAGGAIVNTAATLYTPGKGLKILAKLDVTGKVHGALPKVKDLAKYDKEELGILLGELKQSVQKRIEVTTKLGREVKHGQRQGEEQKLIKAIDKFLNQ